MRMSVLAGSIVLGLIVSSHLGVAQSAPLPDSTLRFLNMIQGRWVPANTGDTSARRPPPDYVVQLLEPTVGGKAFRLREGFPGTNSNAADLDGMVFWNPLTERAEFVAVAGSGPGQGRYFQGVYRPLADGTIERTYDVAYRSLADTPGEELGGRIRRYREIYRAITPDSVESRLDWWRDNRWQPFGPGRYFLVRR